MVHITINGKVLEVEEGANVLDCALENGIYIPHLCHHKDLSPLGSCRMCIVEVEGQKGVTTSCTLKAAEGLKIRTDSEEIKRLRERVRPDETLLVADAALGQEAVNVARHFHEAVGLTGIVLTKLDGDARGGAALSMKAVTGVPIKFMGTGEKLEDFSPFHPDRMAQRILGMGDVVSLVEKAQETIDQKEAERLAEKMKKADFDLEDFLAQLQQMKKMGPLGSIMKMMPGMSGVQVGEKEERKLKRTEAIIQSMTKKERARPEILNGSRRARIAKGSGTKVSDVNALLKQFSQMRQMMKMLKGGKMKALMRGLGGKIPGMGGGRFPF